MGVPAFFRWLSRKYPSIIVHCVEEKKRNLDGIDIPIDITKPNPNDVEFDNLYLDMNGIIHPCCHPEDKPPPKNEDEMMVLIFEYIDRLMAIIRPRRLLYMAIDGVAPRAKMNQQRSRRFRAAKEDSDRREEVARIKEELRSKGCNIPADKPASEHFDSNCITPGTPFMFRLAECLRYYIHDRLNNDPGWKGLKVILSDANAPGEGEHKIMNYIRKQRSQPNHDPNTHHCLCGADADLIMLGLATHEPYFTIIREEFKPNKPRPCCICGQIGHTMTECVGIQHEATDTEIIPSAEQEFIFIRLNILREYLEKELTLDNITFQQDFERAIDDWVFMCFFVGNDFLPHLPSLEIREGAIDRLVKLYKRCVYRTGGYLTENGIVNLERVQLVLTDLGQVEDEIFKTRRQNDLNWKKRQIENDRRNKQWNKESSYPSFVPSGQFAPQPVGQKPESVSNPKSACLDYRKESFKAVAQMNENSNKEAAEKLKSMLIDQGTLPPPPIDQGIKRKRHDEEKNDDDDDDDQDEVKLWEDGWKDRYYQSKFGVGKEDVAFRHKVGHAYVLGLCWVMRYYYQGCASWKWFYPYHYAPFASDFHFVAEVNSEFESDTKPFNPLEQLMAVFPTASKQFLPHTWQNLMESPESPIIDFYPINFKIDLNGKKFAWQGVALLPFVDEARLRNALSDVYSDLNADEMYRNTTGVDRLFVGKDCPAFSFFCGLYEGNLQLNKENAASIESTLLNGIDGRVWSDNSAILPGNTVKSPIPGHPNLMDNSSICIFYEDPPVEKGHIFKSILLNGVQMPQRTLKPQDFDSHNRGQRYRPQLGFQPNSGYRPRGSFSTQPMNRFIRANTYNDNNAYNNQNNYNYRPKQDFGRSSNRYNPYGDNNRGRSSYSNNNRGSFNNQRGRGGGDGWDYPPNLHNQVPSNREGYSQSSYNRGRGRGGYGNNNWQQQNYKSARY